MKNKFIYFKMNFFFKLLLCSAIYTHAELQSYLDLGLQKLINKELLYNLITYHQIAKSYSNSYLRSIYNPTHHERIQNALWYSIEEGTEDSITRKSPYAASNESKAYFLYLRLKYKNFLS